MSETGWRRVAHLRPFRLPGGDAAAREPRRAAIGLLYEAFGNDNFLLTDIPPLAAFSPAERAILHTMLARGINAPFTSSAGRLFDAFAALCGLRQHASYEGRRRQSWNGRPEIARQGASMSFPYDPRSKAKRP
jgi:hydrogenase maturation protein HypF